MSDLPGVQKVIDPPEEFTSTHTHRDGTPLMMILGKQRTVTGKNGKPTKLRDRPEFVTEQGQIIAAAYVRKYPRGFKPQAFVEPRSDQVALSAAAAAVALQAGVPGLSGDIPGWTIEGYHACATNRGSGVISVSVNNPHGGSDRYLIRMPEKIVFDLAPEHFE